MNLALERTDHPEAATTWLLRVKVQVPELPAGYLRRAPLQQRLDGSLERKLTVLQAPEGFGKTTLLADAAQATRDRGMVAAWLSLDDDGPDAFASYLAYAFEHAGLDADGLPSRDAWSSMPPVQQIGMIARAIELHAAPCLLVLDELERLPVRTVELVNLLLRRAPRNVHVAMAYRVNPGVGIGAQGVAGDAVIVGTQDLCFSKTDTAIYFGRRLSPAQLDAVAERTAGWPFALTVYRANPTAASEPLDAGAAKLVDNYIGMSLLRDLSPEDRACLFDLAVFDNVEAELVDEVLGSSDARVRIAAVASLNGLVPPLSGDTAVRQVQPLLRDYCLDALSVENPDRKRTIHTRIAVELARRGRMTESWRHARAAGDNRLLCKLIERSGPFRLWMRDGVARLVTAGRFLTPEITVQSPRLDLLRCIDLCLASKWAEAATLCDAIAKRTGGFTRDRDGGDADALAIDGLFAQTVLAGGADGLLPAELEARLPAGDPAAGEERGRLLACARDTMLSVAFYERARFDESARHCQRAQEHCGEDERFGEVFLNTCLGMAAMAQGRAAEATEKYGQARRAARKRFCADPCISASSDVLRIELDLERNRERAVRRRTLERLTQLQGVWVDVHTVAVTVSAELMFGQYGGKAAIQLLTRAVDRVRTAGIVSLSSAMSALLAEYLVREGQADHAGQVWRDHALPCGVVDLLDLERQSWRTMEALSCARVRLLEAEGQLAAAEELAGNLCGVAAERGLVRTRLRGLALSMSVAHRAAQPDRAQDRLVEFIRAARGAGYTRPLVRHAEVSRVVLRRLLDTNLDEELRPAAESMLAQVARADSGGPFFSARELEVLTHVAGGLRNKEIAGRLGITDEGVRYHMKSIFRKTGVSKRAEAVRYAQTLGVIS